MIFRNDLLKMIMNIDIEMFSYNFYAMIHINKLVVIVIIFAHVGVAIGPNCKTNLTVGPIDKCSQCKENFKINSDGTRCNEIMQYCQVYNSQGQCILCNVNFILKVNQDGQENQCGYLTGIKQQILLYDPTSFSRQTICYHHQEYYNEDNKKCEQNDQKIQCPSGYYGHDRSKCMQCGISIPMCALCTISESSTIPMCLACNRHYYVLNKSNETSKCMPCSIYGCLECTTSLATDGSVTCLSCPINSTLYLGSCFGCTSPNFAFSIIDTQCRSCSSMQEEHCRFCIFTNNPNLDNSVECLQCEENFYYSNENKKCEEIITILKLDSSDSGEILKKLAPGIEIIYYNNPIGLMENCNSTNGFVCNCDDLTKTSTCRDIRPKIDQLIDFESLSFKFDELAQFSDLLRMAAEFPQFNVQTLVDLKLDSVGDVLTQYQFWNLLSASTFVINRLLILISDDLSKLITKLSTFILNKGTQMFSEQRVTILQGNGFYFKYIPANLKEKIGEDNYISSNVPSNQSVAYYIFFNRVPQKNASSGVIYIITSSKNSINLVVKKSYLSNGTKFVLTIDGKTADNSVTLNQGYFTIEKLILNQSISSCCNALQIVASQASSSTSDQYYNQRIQNIFYSESWLYILFFIALYLAFLPLCSIVDCCQQKNQLRKQIGSQEPSVQERSSQNNTVIKINYRDFFPIYNVSNTSRPERLRKLCLFIVNMQHMITFLTVIYFNLPGGQPVAAIALVIPAYICTILMGYICGSIFRCLPTNTKYMINLFSLGYWVLWIFLMKSMADKPSNEYRLFILVFTVLSFVLDLVFDSLETLLVYFSIKQEEKQLTLFNCLAKWLSWRGFYQFDKLAKEMQEDQ